MTITYCRNDPVSGRWVGVDRLLTEFEVDYNFYQHETRIATLEANYTLTVSLGSITQPAPDQLLFHKTDGSTDGPFTIPIADFTDRGPWTPSTIYSVNDTLSYNGTLYRVIFNHTSGLTFDPGANDGLGHDFYKPWLTIPGNSLPAGGATGMGLRKSTGADYAVTWSFDDASETTFSPSTASALTSTDVASALEELEGLIRDEVDDARDVTFTPSSGSSLTSTNVADALEELDASITSPDLSDVLHLSGGTLTGPLTLAGDPASAFQAATKQYVDGIATNVGKRQTVRVAATANVVISTGLNSGDVIDGVTLATSDLVLLPHQSTPAQNGIYVVEVSPTRSVEFDTYDEHPGSLIAVQEGTANADTIWLCTSNAGGTLNTTPIVFSQSSTSGALLAATATLVVLNDVNITPGPGVDGYAIKWNNATGKFILAPSTGGTTYSADGTTLTLTGTTFSVNVPALPETTTAQYLANTSGKALSTDKVWAAADYVALTDAATVALDMATFINATVTLGGNRTLGNPSNTKNGQTGVIEIEQDGTGSRTLAYSSNWKFAGGTAPVLTTTASARDLLFYQVISSTVIYGTLVKDVK